MTSSSQILRKTRKELLSEWRREEVLEAARRKFAQADYSETSVEEIAKEAGMAKGTVYLYFKSKDEILAALLRSDLEHLTDQTIDGMLSVKTFKERLAAFMRQRLAFLRDKEDFLRIFSAEFGARNSRSPLVSEALDKSFWRVNAVMRRCLEQAMEAGEIRAVPVETAAFVVFDLTRGFFERHIRDWSRAAPEEDLAFVQSLILNGLGGM
jgi:AcrR family transcriptional regulator